MRLSEYEAGVLVSCGQALFEGPWILELFGSRIDDRLRGGDIDILFTFERERDRLAALQGKAAYLARVKGLIGEQKLDVVMTTCERAMADAFIQSPGDRRIQLGTWQN